MESLAPLMWVPSLGPHHLDHRQDQDHLQDQDHRLGLRTVAGVLRLVLRPLTATLIRSVVQANSTAQVFALAFGAHTAPHQHHRLHRLLHLHQRQVDALADRSALASLCAQLILPHSKPAQRHARSAAVVLSSRSILEVESITVFGNLAVVAQSCSFARMHLMHAHASQVQAYSCCATITFRLFVKLVWRSLPWLAPLISRLTHRN